MADRRRTSARPGSAVRAASRRERPTRERVAPRRAGARRSRTARTREPVKRRVAGGRERTPAPTPRRPTSRRVTRRRRVLIGILSALALVGFLFAFVYPTRTYLEQREQIGRAQDRLTVLRQQTAALERDTARLEGDAEIERVAREQYGLVRPGETPYVIVPPVATPPNTP